MIIILTILSCGGTIHAVVRFREDGADEDEEDDNDCCDGGDNPGPTILPGAFQPIFKVARSL